MGCLGVCVCVIACLLFVNYVMLWASHLGGSGPGCKIFSYIFIFTIVVLAYMDDVVCFKVLFHVVMRV